MVNDDHFINIAHLTRSPLGKDDLHLLAVVVPAGTDLGTMGHDKRLEEGVACEAVGPVQSGAGGLAHGIEAMQGALAVKVGLHAAALVMRGRNNGDRPGGDVDPKAEAGLVDGRKSFTDEAGRLMGDVEIDARLPGPLHLRIDGPRHDIARGEFKPLVILLHEALPLPVGQNPTLAPDRFGDQERLGLWMVEAGRVELHELHVRDLRPGAPCHGDAVTGGDVGIGRVEVDPAAAPGREDRHIGAQGFDLAGDLVKDVEPDAAVPRGVAELARGDEIDGHVVLHDRDAGMRGDGGQQRLLDLETGGVPGMKDATLGVPALASEIGLAVSPGRHPLVEVHPERDEFGDPLRSLGHDASDNLLFAQTVTGDEGVADMEIRGILAARDAGDTPLGPGGVRIGTGLLGHDGDAPLAGGLQGESQAGDAAADDHVVEGFHREMRRLSIRRTRPIPTATSARARVLVVRLRIGANVDSSTITA